MKANNVDLVHKTVAELFDMIKGQQKKIDELEAIISKIRDGKAELTEAHINESFKLNNLK